MDLSMFQGEAPSYMQYNSNSHLISPNAGYAPDTNWHSDVDMGTPSTAAFPNDTLEAYQQSQPTSNNHLRLPEKTGKASVSAHGHRKSEDGISPHQRVASQTEAARQDDRPIISRSITAPEQRQARRSTGANSALSSMKRSGSEDSEDEYVPTEEPKGRGRKRQRIPHTAVERRYRENLNAHLDKLRQTVPSLASRRTSGGAKALDGPGEGVKPSKCEILNGAIEHIGILDRDNQSLRGEVKGLRARLEDLERWYSASLRNGGPYGD